MIGGLKGAAVAQKVDSANLQAETQATQAAATPPKLPKTKAAESRRRKTTKTLGKRKTKADLENLAPLTQDEMGLGADELGAGALGADGVDGVDSKSRKMEPLSEKATLGAAMRVRATGQAAKGIIPNESDELETLSEINDLNSERQKEQAKDAEAWKSLVMQQSTVLRSENIFKEKMDELLSKNSPSQELVEATIRDAREEMVRRKSGLAKKTFHHLRNMGRRLLDVDLPGAMFYPMFDAIQAESTADADQTIILTGDFKMADLSGPNMTAEDKDELGTLLFMDTIRGIGLEEFVCDLNDTFAKDDFGVTRDFMESEPSMNHLIDFVRHNYADKCKFEIDETEEPKFVQDARQLLDAICLETSEFAWRIRGIASAIVYTYSKDKIHTLSAQAKSQNPNAEVETTALNGERESLMESGEARANPEDRYKVECSSLPDDAYGGEEVTNLRSDCEKIVCKWELSTLTTKNSFKTIGQDLLNDIDKRLSAKMLAEETKTDRFLRNAGDVLSFAVNHETTALISYMTVSLGVILGRVVAEREAANLLGKHIGGISVVEEAIQRSVSAMGSMFTGSPESTASAPNRGDIESVATAITEATANATSTAGIDQVGFVQSLKGFASVTSLADGTTLEDAVGRVTSGLSEQLMAANATSVASTASMASATSVASTASVANGTDIGNSTAVPTPAAGTPADTLQRLGAIKADMQKDVDTGLIAGRADALSGYDRSVHSAIALYLIVGYCVQSKRSRDRGAFAAEHTVEVLKSMSESGLVDPELAESLTESGPLEFETSRYAQSMGLTITGAIRGLVNAGYAIVDVLPQHKNIYGGPFAFRIAGPVGTFEEMIRMCLLGGDRVNIAIMDRIGEMSAKGVEVGERQKRFVKLALYKMFKDLQSSTPSEIRKVIGRLTGGDEEIAAISAKIKEMQQAVVDKYNILVNPEEHLTMETFEDKAVSAEDAKELNGRNSMAVIFGSFLGVSCLAAQYILYYTNPHLLQKIGGLINMTRLVALISTGYIQSKILKQITGEGLGFMSTKDSVVKTSAKGNAERIILCELFGQSMEAVNMAIVLTALGMGEQGVSVLGDRLAGIAQLANEREIKQSRTRYAIEGLVMLKVIKKYCPSAYPRLCHVYQETYQDLYSAKEKSDLCPAMETREVRAAAQVRKRVANSAKPTQTKEPSFEEISKRIQELIEEKEELQRQMKKLQDSEDLPKKPDSKYQSGERRASVVSRLGVTKSRLSGYGSSEGESEYESDSEVSRSSSDSEGSRSSSDVEGVPLSSKLYTMHIEDETRDAAKQSMPNRSGTSRVKAAAAEIDRKKRAAKRSQFLQPEAGVMGR